MTGLVLYSTDGGRSQIKLQTKDQTVWLSQREMAPLFALSSDYDKTVQQQVLQDFRE